MLCTAQPFLCTNCIIWSPGLFPLSLFVSGGTVVLYKNIAPFCDYKECVNMIRFS